MVAISTFYMNRPKTNKEKLDILDFLELERRIDEENKKVYESMDKSHLTKGKQNKMNSAINGRDGWIKSNDRLSKHYADSRPFNMNGSRNWMHS